MTPSLRPAAVPTLRTAHALAIHALQLTIHALAVHALLPAILASAQVLPEVGTPDQDDIFLAASDDGSSFAVKPDPVFRRGSSPELLRLLQGLEGREGGTYAVYFVDFSVWTGQPNTERLAVAFSPDGVTWSDKQEVQLDPPRFMGRATDPSVVQLEDGRLRMYFMTPGPAGTRQILSAVSTDGVRFQVEDGVRIAGPGNCDVYRGTDTWYLFLGDEERNITTLAISRDGLDWTWVNSFQVRGNCPGVLPIAGGDARLYVNDGEIALHAFDAASLSSRLLERSVVAMRGAMVGDPSPVTAGGNILMAFKRRQPPANGPGATRFQGDPRRSGPPPLGPDNRPGGPPHRHD